MGKYVIRGWIEHLGGGSYRVEAQADPAGSPSQPPVARIERCEACTDAQARSACCESVARLSHEIMNAGHEVLDVVILQDGHERR